MLEVRRLTKSFGGFSAVDGVDVSIAAGQIHGLIGPNGAGKTTVFNLVTGVLAPTAGTVRVAGRDVTGWRPDRITALGVARTFQNIRLFRELSVLDNVMVARHCRTRGGFLAALVRVPGRSTAEERDTRRRAEKLLELVGLDRRGAAAAEDLALVEQRRLELARALASEPRLLLLDEPAAGMTAIEIAELNRLVRKIRDTGVTVLLTEHHMSVVMEISDAITVLSYGKKIAEGAPADVRRDPAVLEAYLGPG